MGEPAIALQPLTLKIDEAVHAAAKEFGESYRYTMQLLARRSSIEVIADMIGLSEPRSAADERTLNAIGAYFSARGYIPPKLHENSLDKEEEKRMSALTREQYLEKRNAGMSKSDIAREVGVKSATISYYLNKWSLLRPSDEQRAMREYAGVRLPAEPKDKSIPVAVLARTGNDQPAVLVEVHAKKEESVPMATAMEEKKSVPSITLTIPIGEAPDGPEAYADLTRSQLMRQAIRMLRTAASRAADDARDLLGTEDVSRIVEAFAQRQL